MVEPTEELSLLGEYVQWKAAGEVRRPDLSPEEFMRDRLKQVAFDRVEQALDFIKTKSEHSKRGHNAHPFDMIAVEQILEGTYVEADPAPAEDSPPAGQESVLKIIEDTRENLTPRVSGETGSAD